MELKLKKAGRLLDTTELPVAMISSSLGFEDQMDFSKTFRKSMGCLRLLIDRRSVARCRKTHG